MITGLVMAMGGGVAAPLNPADFPPLVDRYASGAATIDTDAQTFGPHVGTVVDGVVVFSFGELTLDQDVTVVGSRPLALLSHGDLTVDGRLDASALGSNAGPGGARPVNRSNGEGLGGGRAGIAGSGAGHCGAGGDALEGVVTGGAPHGSLTAALSGGSAGGASTTPGGGGGAGGGGAVELGALGVLRIDGSILADGGDAEDRIKDAGGGGSGGGVLLHGGAGSECRGRISVRGGDGGSSAGDYAGAGGGAGCVSALGLDVAACLIDVAGGVPGGDQLGVGGATSAAPGETAEPETVPDPDFDGDGYAISDGDCNDLDRDIRPDAEEIADGLDNDCDGSVDEYLGDTGSTGDTGSMGDTGSPGGSDPVPGPDGDRLPGYRLWGCSAGATPTRALAWQWVGGLVLLGRRSRRGSGA